MTAADAAHRSRLLLCLATVYLLWSSSFLATKIGVTRLPPFLFGSVRFIVGGALLFIVSRVLAVRRGAAPLPVIDAAEWKRLLVVGFCTILVSCSFAIQSRRGSYYSEPFHQLPSPHDEVSSHVRRRQLSMTRGLGYSGLFSR